MITHVKSLGSGDSWWIPGIAATTTIALGLIFVFVWAPHPWGWEGIDHYHDLGLRLARGEPFPTTDVPWGYAYFLAGFYYLAGDRPWVPLVAQVVLNGLVPLMLYPLVRDQFGRRVASVAVMLAAFCSFNTVYASTQASDAVCTVIVVAGVWLFAVATRSDSWRAFAASGLLCGLAPQFRPNLIVLPFVLAAAAYGLSRTTKPRLPGLALYVTLAATASLPWIARNYRLTGEFIPTSTHGGIQLWYGSLQAGPYLASGPYNPKSRFEPPAFEYTSLAGRTLIVSAVRDQCAVDSGASAHLVYWTDRDPSPRSIPPETRTPADRLALTFAVPAQPNHTTVYYYAEAQPRAGYPSTWTPPGGRADPYVFFVDDRHLDDLDRHGDVYDAFDLIRLLRALGFHEPGPADRLDVTGDGLIDEQDLRTLVTWLMNDDDVSRPSTDDVVSRVAVEKDAVTLWLTDGSTFAVPRQWSRIITDITATRGLAARLCYAHRRATWRAAAAAPADRKMADCVRIGQVRVNDVFYRAEPHRMRRYTALALDNIRRDPLAFIRASAYRAVRLFVIEGTDDPQTAHQFGGSGRIYALATAASSSLALAGAAGVAIAMRRRQTVWPLLTPIVTIPATICFVLTNMRYTVTVQPFLFAFVAVTLTAVWRDRRQIQPRHQ